MVSGRVSKIIGIENIDLKKECGEKLVLQDVKFMLKMKINIISIGKLNDKGYNCEFDNR